MKLAVGADHGGFELKSVISKHLEQCGHVVIDVGAHNMNSKDDYPDFARAVGVQVASENADRGIMICGSGVGASIVANKIRGIRASVCHDTYSAHQGVEHDDMNIICLGARIIGSETAKEITNAFVSATFTGEDRHRRRLEKVLAIEEDSFKS